MWFIALIAFLVGGASMPLPGPLGTDPAVTPGDTGNKCYRLEPNQKITLAPGSVVSDCEFDPGDPDKIVPGGKTFIRVRQMVKIVNAKIAEGRSNWGTCNTTEPNGYGALRKVGSPPVAYPASSTGDIFWEDMNHKREDLKDFILVLTEKDDKYHTFDVYIDETKKDSIPDYVENCVETGGLVAVPDVAAAPQFPPVAFATTDVDFNTAFGLIFDKSCPGCETAFNDHESELVDKYFLKMSKQNVPDIAEQVGVVTITIDNETRNYDVFIHVGTVYLEGQIGQPDEGESWMYNASATKPPIEAPFDTESLKLKELKFVYVAPWTWATPECKPAIYLYPEDPMEVSVKVKPKGRITTSKPEHGKDGWRVMAYPDGTLIPNQGDSARLLGTFSSGHSQEASSKFDNNFSCSLRENLGEPLSNQESKSAKFSLPAGRHGVPFEKVLSQSCLDQTSASYPYLYYETELDKVRVPESGWIVQTQELTDFFIQLLPKLGLNQREQEDFLEYWVPKLSQGKRWFIGLVDRGELDRVEPIEFSTTPDTFIRVRFYFEELTKGSEKWEVGSGNVEEFEPTSKNQGISLLDQKYPTSHFPPRRIGFTAVDWGGILENGNCGVDAYTSQ